MPKRVPMDFVSVQEVAEFIDEGKVEDEVVIIDVRDPCETESLSGHIRVARLIPHYQFHEDGRLIAQDIARKKFVVLHCQYSQIRAPRSARILRRYLNELEHATCQVVVMRGGYRTFYSAFYDALDKYVTRYAPSISVKEREDELRERGKQLFPPTDS